MPTVVRPSGLTIDAPDTYRIQPTGPVEPDEAPSRRARPGRSRVSGPVPMPPLAHPPAADPILDAVQGQGFDLVDRVDLEPQLEPATPDGRRRAAAVPIPVVQSATLEVPLAAGEDAVLLVEQDGVYSWNLPDGSTPVAAPTGAVRRSRHPGRRIHFTVEIHADRGAAGAARRGILSDLVYGRVRVYALKFVAGVAIGSGVRFLERHVRRGLVSMTGGEPAQWALVAPASVGLPRHRPPRILLFVHGTFSSTIGSFGALAATPWGRAFLDAAGAGYDAVLGFDHPTLSDDPVANATELLHALESVDAPSTLQIDFVAFSRGGLVVRTLIEHLLPHSGLRYRIGRGVFVACPNAGTSLASPEHWHDLVDLYTNLAAGACRLLALLPQASAAALVLKELLQGAGALVKHLATGAAGDVPGLAAMRPGGAFLQALNTRQPGQPEPGAIAYFAVTSEFRAAIHGADHQPRDLPRRLVLALADGLIDRLMGEANDLVVHTSSMTAIDESIGTCVTDALAFGPTPLVHHITYFTRPEVVGALARWLEVAEPDRAAGSARRIAGDDVAATLPSIPQPRIESIPAIVDTGIVVADASAPAGDALALIDAHRPSYVVVRRQDPGDALYHYAFDPEEILRKVRASSDTPLGVALDLHESDSSQEEPIAGVSGTVWTGDAPSSRRTVVFLDDTPVGVVPERDADAAADLVALARTVLHPSRPGDYTTARRVMPSFRPSERRALAAAGAAPAHAVAGPVRRSRSRTPGAIPLIEEPAPAQTECQFLAEMDGEVPLHQVVTLEVCLSREETTASAGRASAHATGMVSIGESATLLVQIVPRLNLVLANPTDDRIEVEPPAPGNPTFLYFDVQGAHPGQGEVWVLVRQRQMGIARLVLKPVIVERARRPSGRRLAATADSAGAPPLAAALDQLLVVEQAVGDTVQYLYELDMPSLNVFELMTSAPLEGRRDQFVAALYQEIENRYVSTYDAAAHQDAVEAFTHELQGYGAMLFDELFPARMQDLLWRHRDAIRSIRIVSTEPFIPWEIVHLHEPGHPIDPSEPQRFLGQMGLVRWLHGVGGLPPPVVRVRRGQARYVIPDYPHPDWRLPQTVAERQYLEQQLLATPIEAQPRPLQAALTQPGAFDLLHFACHGEAESATIAQARIVLQGRVDGATFVPAHVNASTVAAYARLEGPDGARPLVFLNACQAGRAGYVLTGTGGFAQAFLRAGAGAFVGTLWSVGDEPAFLFGRTFYDRLLGGATIAEAAIAAREDARRGGDATWLAYVVYAHPHAVLMMS